MNDEKTIAKESRPSGSTPPDCSIPTWIECSTKADNGRDLTALEKFIYGQEPKKPWELGFRKDLQDVVNELNDQVERPQKASKGETE